MANTQPSDGSDQLFRLSMEESQTSKGREKTNPDPRLADGMPLPKYLREKFPKHLLGMPIQEIDSFYESQKTYLIISTKWVIHRFISTKSIWILSPFNRLRWLLIRAITHSFFHYFMLVVILSLAVFIPFSRFFHETKVFLLPYYWIFSIEAIIKILAYGLVMKPFSYLRNPWNWMDFILTIVGWYIECFVADESLYGVQCLRVLRLIWFFTYPRLSFSWMFHTLHLMKDVLIYGGFIFLFFTMLTRIQYQGVLPQNCLGNQTTASMATSEKFDYSNCSHQKTCQTYGNEFNENWWNASVLPCPDGYMCFTNFGKNPNYCNTDFDNFFSAGLGTLRLMAKDSWDHLFAEIAVTSGSWNILFFFIVVVFGNYILINIIAAQVAVSLNQFLDILDGKLPRDKLKRRSISTMKQEIDTVNAEVSPIFKVEQEVVSLTNLQWDTNNDNMEQFSMENDYEDESAEDVIVDDEDLENQATLSLKQQFSNCCSSLVSVICAWNCCCECWMKFQKWLVPITLGHYFNSFICFCILCNLIILTMDHHHMPPYFTVISLYSSYVFTAIYLIEVILKVLSLSPKHYFNDPWNVFEFFIAIGCLIELLLENISGLAIMRFFRMFRVLRFGRWWPGFGALMRTISNNSIVLFVIVLLFATMGLFLFGDNYAASRVSLKASGHPRWYMMDFTHSLLLVVRILCGEWTETLRDCRDHSGWICILYFIMVVSIGNLVTALEKYCLLNILVLEYRNREVIKIQDEFTGEIKNNASTRHFKKTKDEILSAEACCWDVSCKFLPECTSISSFCSFWKQWHCFRIKILVLINNKYYDTGMAIIIVMSTIPLGLDGAHFHKHPILTSITVITDITVFVLFSLEIVLKIIGFGFKKFFSDGWLRFDFIITVVVISAMLYQISLLLDTILACGVLWLLFGVTGMQLFAGRYYRCLDHEGRHVFSENHTLEFQECISYNYTWKNSNFNFDNIQNAFLALLHMATLKGWNPIIQNATDNPEDFYRTHRAINVHLEWFFVLFLIFGVFCCFALILSTFVKKTNKRRKQIRGGYIEMLMTVGQRKVYSLRRKTFFQVPTKGILYPNSRSVPFIIHLAASKMTTMISIILILCNAVFTVMFYESPESDVLHSFYGYFDLGFFVAFGLEIGLKMTAFGCQFFRKPWNIYDFGILIFSSGCYILLEFGIVLFRTGLLSGLRILRLIRWLKSVRRTVFGVWYIFPALLNVGMLMAVLASSYAILGMAYFKGIPVMLEHGVYHGFDEFFPILTVMTEMSLGSTWDFFYDSLARVRGAVAAATFLVSYLFLSYLIIIGCGTVVLLEQCDYLQTKLQLGVTDEDLEGYKCAWRKMDPEATGSIHREELADFLNHLQPWFQIQRPSVTQVTKFNIPVDEKDRIAFDDLLQVLVNHTDDNCDQSIRSSELQTEIVSVEVASPSTSITQI